MRVTKFIVMIVMLLALVGCSNSADSKIPELKITTNHEDVLVTRGGYNWTTKLNGAENKTEIADTNGPVQIAKDMEGTIVLSESPLELRFTKNPKRITVLNWHEAGADEWISSDTTFTAPTEEGTYIFEILAQWEQGTVSYTTKIIVKNN